MTPEPAWHDVLLAVMENAVRLAREAGATEQQIRDAVEWAIRTPNGMTRGLPFNEPLDDPT